MKVTNGHGDLDRIELSTVFTKALGVPKMHKKFTAANKTHNEEYLLVSHKDIAHSHEEWMISL